MLKSTKGRCLILFVSRFIATEFDENILRYNVDFLYAKCGMNLNEVVRILYEVVRILQETGRLLPWFLVSMQK